MKRRRSVGFALCLALGCGGGGGAPPATGAGALPVGSAARVGSQWVSVATVARISAAQATAPRQAAALAVSDALFAEGARAGLPAATVRTVERASAARSLLEQIGREAAQAGPPTPAELSELAQERWLELARPTAVRTTHAVVLNDKPERDAAARALADKLAAALTGVSTSAELIRVAGTVPAAGFQIRAESLPFVTADGRAFQRTDNGFRASAPFDPAFARAANLIAQPGERSPVVKSAFGYHVILLEQRLPGETLSEAQLSERLASDVVVRRASRARRALLEKLRQASPVRIERAADALTARVEAAP